MYKIISRRTIRILFITVLIAAFLICEFILSVNKEINRTDLNSLIADLGISIDEDSVVSVEVYIPQHFDETYTEYNLLQQKAGYNLREYAGKKTLKTTYKLNGNDEYVLNVLTYKNRIIGGDISSLLSGGEILPLTSG